MVSFLQVVVSAVLKTRASEIANKCIKALHEDHEEGTKDTKIENPKSVEEA